MSTNPPGIGSREGKVQGEPAALGLHQKAYKRIDLCRDHVYDDWLSGASSNLIHVNVGA